MGTRWVADLDLEKFFDRVNHDLLHGAGGPQQVGDKRVLEPHPAVTCTAGVMAGGLDVAPSPRGRRKAGRYRPCCPTFCWTTWTGNWKRRGHRFVPLR